MKALTFAVLSTLGVSVGFAADATSPLDYRDRNETYAPGTSVPAQKQKPELNRSVQDKRVDSTTIEKKTAPLGERQAPIAIQETRPKEVREKDSRRPEIKQQPTSSFDHRQASISTTSDVTKPPTVAKYQDSLTAASATNMARFPAVDRATTAKINRFVFRKNPTDASASVGGSPVIPAAGGSAPLK